MEVVAFTDTNINTHFAISVSPDITTAHFKRELERAHLTLFPTFGPIKALHLTVRRKRSLYHLTDSLPVKYAFQCSKRRWFLHVIVHPSTICLNNPVASGSLITHSKPMNLGNKTTIEQIRTTSDELESVSGKMECNCSKDRLNPLLEFRSPSSHEKAVGVGRRIVFATNKVRVSPKPVISLYKQRLSCNMSSVHRLSVFEISDSDD